MKTINIKAVLTLALISMMLTVGTGAAFAAVSWPGSDDSKYQSSASYTQFITSSISVKSGDSVSWKNSLTVYGSIGYYPEVAWALTDGSGYQGTNPSAAAYKDGNTWPTTTYQTVSRVGSYQCGVCHWYDTTSGGSGPNTGTRGMPYTATA